MKDLVVTTTSGAVLGTELADGCLLWAGIPYAKPPVAELRFRPPVPVTPWEGLRDATQFGPASVQTWRTDAAPVDFQDTGPVDVVGEEDCLTLNVWSPALDGRKRPVYIWIHGGANHLEGSRLPIYHGDALALRGDIVVVSLNYRLGILGFADVEPVLGPEYRHAHVNGLKDQLLAIDWIRANVAAFGGDPDQMTVAGESAGGIDVSWLLASGRLKGVVKRAVIMSNVTGSAGIGGDGPRWRHSPQTVRQISQDIVQRAGLADRDTLLGAPADHLVRAVAALDYDDDIFGLDCQFYPGLDGELLTVPPMEALGAGAMAGIDLLIGYTNYEAGLWLTFQPELETADPAWMAATFGFLSAATQSEAVAAYADFFPHETPSVQGMYLVSDVGFTLPTTWFAEAAEPFSKVWMYRADYEVDDRLRAMHAADLPFFFARPHSAAGAELIGPTTDETRALRDRLCDEMAGALIAFIRKGDPGWPAYDRKGGLTRIFGGAVAHMRHPLGARKAFWEASLLSRFTGRDAPKA